MNNVKTKVDDLDVHKSKNVPLDLKKLSYVGSKKVVKNTKFNKLNTKVKKKKIPDRSTLININQYNTYKTAKFGEKIEYVDKKVSDISFLGIRCLVFKMVQNVNLLQ